MFKPSCLSRPAHRALRRPVFSLALAMTLGLGALLWNAAGSSPAQAAQAADSPKLPGGAAALREAFGDWTVTCAIAEQGPDKVKTKVCALSQETFEEKSRQRVVAAEITPTGMSGANATMVLPFGLALENGALLQVDNDAKSVVPLAFKTCLPAGCVATGTLDAKLLTALRAGNSLQVIVHANGDSKDTPLTLSLKGFANALDRARVLLTSKK